MKCVSANQEDIIVLYDFNKRLINEYEDLTKIDYDYVLKWIYHKIEKHIDEYEVKIEDSSVVDKVFEIVKNKKNITKFVVEEPSLNEIFVSKVGESFEK